MKKLLILLLFIPIFLVSCSGEKVQDIDSSEIEAIEEEARKQKEGVVADDKKVSDYTDDIEAINAFIKRQNTFSKYEKISEGVTKTFWVNQQIYAKVTKDGSNFNLLNKTDSSMKNQYHEANFGDKVEYKNSADSNFTETTLEDYKKTFGVTPYDNTLFDYVITADTVKEIKREKENDNYTFTLKLDPSNDATAKYLAIQMYKLGELDGAPKFTSIDLTITMDEDFVPIKGTIKSNYTIVYIFSLDCEQTLDVTFKVEK